VSDWIQELGDSYIGEILLTSIDRDGTRLGFDLALLDYVRKLTSLPLIVSGGIRSSQNVIDVYNHGAQGAVLASMLHLDNSNVIEIKNFLSKNDVEVRL